MRLSVCFYFFIIMKTLFLSVLILFAYISTAAAQTVYTWEDCLREAAKNHPDLIAAQESVEQSKESKAITASGLLPQVSADASFSVTQKHSTGSSKTSSAGISATQLVFDGAKTVNEVAADAENVKAAQENFRYTSTQVRLRLRTAFVDLLKAQTLLGITKDIYDIRRQDLQLISLRYQSGTEHRGALLTAQANLAQAQLKIDQAQRDLGVAQYELNKELGVKEFSPIAVRGDFAIQQDVMQKPDFAAIVDRHPSLLKAIAQENAAAYGIKSSQAEFYPTVSLDGGVSKSGTAWPPDNNVSDVGVSVSVPVFEGGLRRAQLAKAKSTHRQLQASRASTRDGILLALQQAWSTLENAAENIGVKKQFLEAAQERAKIAEAQYAVGLISFDNWTIIEDDLVQQKTAFLDAQASALLAQADWVAAKGETLEYEK